jgi:O-antigen/teichoic acid export membrane protein
VQKINLIITRFFIAAVAIFSAAYVVKQFPPNFSSEYFLFLSSYNIFLLFFLWGGDISVSKSSASDPSVALDVDVSIFQVSVVAFLVWLPTSFLVSEWGYFTGGVAAFFSIPFVVFSFRSRDVKKFFQFQLLRNGFFVFVTCLALIVFDLFIPLLDFYYFGVCVAVCCFALTIFVLYRYYPIDLFCGNGVSALNLFAIVRERFHFFLIGFCNTAMFWLDVPIAKIFMDDESVAIVGVLGRFSAAVNMVYLVLFNYYSPGIARKCVDSVGFLDAGSVLRNVQRNMFLFFGFIVFCYYFFGGYFFGLFGEGVVEYYRAFYFYLLGHLGVFLFGLYKSALYFSGFQRSVSLSSLVFLVLYSIGAYFFGRWMGVWGIAVSFGLSMFFSSVLGWVMFRYFSEKSARMMEK